MPDLSVDSKISPTKKASVRPKKSGGFWGRLLFIVCLLLVVLIALYGAGRYPTWVNRLTGWQVPSWLVKVLSDSTPTGEPTLDERLTRAQKTINALTTQVDSLVEQMESLEEKVSTATTRALRSEQQVIQLNTQISQLKASPTATGVALLQQVRLIDLALRLNGDTVLAASELRRLATGGNVEESRGGLLLDEAARLDSQISRSRLLDAIHALRPPITNDNESTPLSTDSKSSFWQGVIDLFQIRHTQSSSSLNTKDRQALEALVWRLELYVLTGQTKAYWKLLQTTAFPDYNHVQTVLEKLKAHGTPQYQLLFLQRG